MRPRPRSATGGPSSAAGVRFRADEVTREQAEVPGNPSVDFCVVGKDAPKRPARSLTGKSSRQVGRCLAQKINGRGGGRPCGRFPS